MTDKPIDKTKLNPMSNAFMELFEKNYNVKFVDVTGEEIIDQELPTDNPKPS